LESIGDLYFIVPVSASAEGKPTTDISFLGSIPELDPSPSPNDPDPNASMYG
jgi:hypothetical protein